MYFIALVAPAEINRAVLGWKEYMRERYGCVVGLRSPAHVTLVPPFWMDPAQQADLEGFLKEFSLRWNKFLLQLHNFSAFPPRVIFIHVKESLDLLRLRDEIMNGVIELRKFRVDPDERPYRPHLTIAGRDLTKTAFREAWEHFKNKTYTAEWHVEDIALLRHNKKNWDVVHTSRFKNNL